MKIIGQLLTMRDKQIQTTAYRLKLALRDKPDYSNDLPEEPLIKEVVHRHSDMSKKDFDALRQLQGKVEYLTQKLNDKTQSELPF